MADFEECVFETGVRDICKAERWQLGEGSPHKESNDDQELRLRLRRISILVAPPSVEFPAAASPSTTPGLSPANP